MLPVESTNQSRAGQAEALATGRILVAAGLITQPQLVISMKQRDMQLVRGQSVFLDEILIRNRFVSEREIADALAAENGTSKRGISQTILPLEVCERFTILPVRVIGDVLEIKAGKRLTPRNEATIMAACLERVKRLTVLPADLVEIYDAHKRLSSGEFTFEQMLGYMKNKEITGAMLRQAIQAMLVEAIELRASDLRIGRRRDPGAWISHRIDGVVQQTHLIPEKLMSALFTRLKNECNMDASDDRHPQDGRLSIFYKGRTIEFRVSTVPLSGGESMACRVLDGDSSPTLARLFPNQPDMTQMFKRMSRVKGKQGGIVLFTGPTGSGKTTSLNALMQQLPRDAMNVLTVEDPIEYMLPFAMQVEINKALDQKMSDIERVMLRQDPDVLVVGEIRDYDSLKTALRFAESGHLVMATLHAKSAEESFGRILSMIGPTGKEDALYLLANTLRVVINQQLAPHLCTCCRPVSEEEFPEVRASALAAGINVVDDALLFKRVGCPRCKQTGIFGRVAAHETLIIPMDRTVRGNLGELLYEGVNAFSKIRSLNGVIYKSRGDTLARLAEGGVCAIDSAISTLQQEFI